MRGCVAEHFEDAPARRIANGGRRPFPHELNALLVALGIHGVLDETLDHQLSQLEAHVEVLEDLLFDSVPAELIRVVGPQPLVYEVCQAGEDFTLLQTQTCGDSSSSGCTHLVG